MKYLRDKIEMAELYTVEIASHTVSETRIAPNPYNDKQYIVSDSTETLPWGHWRIALIIFCVLCTSYFTYILYFLYFAFYLLYIIYVFFSFTFCVSRFIVHILCILRFTHILQFYTLRFMYFTFYTYFTLYILRFMYICKSFVFYNLRFIIFIYIKKCDGRIKMSYI